MSIATTHYTRRYPVNRGVFRTPAIVNRQIDRVTEWIVHNHKYGYVLHSVERTEDGCAVIMVGQRRA